MLHFYTLHAKFEMLSLFSRNEKWNDFWFHSFREVKVKFKCLEIERWNCKIILEKRDSRRLLNEEDEDDDKEKYLFHEMF